MNNNNNNNKPQAPSRDLKKRIFHIQQVYNTRVDQLTPFTMQRWAGTAMFALLFMVRIYFIQGWYIVTYALGIYLLNIFLAFLQPKFDPSLSADAGMDNDSGSSGGLDGPSLPTSHNEEFRPFIRRLPEFKFWYSATRAIALSMMCTFFHIFNVPVFWPVLLLYFIVLFTLTMKKQIRHMIKYKQKDLQKVATLMKIYQSA